jgi:hypothetical protein
MFGPELVDLGAKVVKTIGFSNIMERMLLKPMVLATFWATNTFKHYKSDQKQYKSDQKHYKPTSNNINHTKNMINPTKNIINPTKNIINRPETL